MNRTLHAQHVMVLGLGTSGLAMARWCAGQGAQVTVLDNRSAPPQAAALAASVPGARVVCGAFDASWLAESDVQAVFSSPGLAPHQTAPLMEAARASGLWVGGELSLFSHGLQVLATSQAYHPTVLAVTGTNGKTTVTALTGALVRAAGKTVAVAGNIGPTLLDTLAQALANSALPEVWVLELSSFQLAAAEGFDPTAAAVLNLSQDHLDWHPDMEHYAASKARVLGPNTLAVLNRDDPAVMALLPPPLRVRQHLIERAHVTFGLSPAHRPGDYGLEEAGGMVWLVRAQDTDDTIKPRRRVTGPHRGAAAPAGGGAAPAVASVAASFCEASELHIQRLLPTDALRIRGRHNAGNAQAALALASAAGCAMGPMLFALRDYRGEPHRVQHVATINGVAFFDDSKGTNVGATVAALEGLGNAQRLLLILGGEGKGQDFMPLAAPVRQFVRTVVLIGRDAALIRQALANTGVPLLDAESMPHAVELANANAQAGDAVLMSPACASFDMFRDYAHRAQVFCEAVAAIALAQGIALEIAA